MQSEHYHTDHLGNVRLAFSDLDGDGTITVTDIYDPENEITQERHYYPFGLTHNGPWYATVDPDNAYRYNGKELDEATGLYEYGFRWYDPAIGRFTGVDPIADQFAWVSPYNYAENEPVGSIDLWGLQRLKVTDGARIPGTDKTGTEIRVVDPAGDLNIDYYQTTNDGEVFVSSSNSFRNDTEQHEALRIVGTYTDDTPDDFISAKYIETITNPVPEETAAGRPNPPPTNLRGGFDAYTDQLDPTRTNLNSVIDNLNANENLRISIIVGTNLPEFNPDGSPVRLANPATIGGATIPTGVATTRQLLNARGQAVQRALMRRGIDPSRMVFQTRFNQTGTILRVIYRQ